MNEDLLAVQPNRSIDLGGTIRAEIPTVTLARAKSVFGTVGITRLANVTGLDHVGIPTYVAVRPLARSLTVSQGKGLTDELAQVSAAMECIELYHAEMHVPRGHLASLADAASDRAYVHPGDLPIRSSAASDGSRRLEWVSANDLLSGGKRFIPREMVDLDFTQPTVASSTFVPSSNGLASGNTIEEALLHAICELIERDQMSFWQVEHDLRPGRYSSRIDLGSVRDPACGQLIERVLGAGLEMSIWHTPGCMDVPCFSCSIYDGRRATLFPMRASGHGCHPVRRIALARAITEALQSRLTHISGSRDDIYWDRFEKDLPLDTAPNQRWLAARRAENATCDFESTPDTACTESIAHLLQVVVDALRREGLEEILVLDLTTRVLDIPVVKAVIPGIEYAAHKPNYTPGSRMQRFMSELGV